MRRGDIFWVDLGEPKGSDPGFRRPVLVIQADALNASRLATVVVLSLTSNIELRRVPGCLFLSSHETGLPKDSVLNATQVKTIDRSIVEEHVGQLDDAMMFSVDAVLRQVLGL